MKSNTAAKPKPKLVRTESNAEYDEEADGYVPIEQAALYKTVDMFGAIIGKRLLLKDGPQPWSDGVTITAPLDNPYAYQIVERQLAHILFRSDPEARALFVNKYASLAAKAASGKVDEGALAKAVEAIVDVLDTYRVLSLWEDLYPGSAEIIRGLLLKSVTTEVKNPHSGVVLLLAALAAGAEVPSGKLDRFRSTMELALKRVSDRSYAVTLATARWLVVKLVDELVASKREAEVTPREERATAFMVSVASGERADALEKLLAEMGELPKATAERFGPVREMKVHERGVEESSQQIANNALLANPVDDMFLQSGALSMAALKTKATEKISSVRFAEESLIKDCPAKVVFHETEFPETEPPALSAQEDEAVRRLRAQFVRVMGRRRSMLDDQGVEVDVVSLVERRITRQPIPVFRREERGQGFHAMLLIDLSDSMEGVDKGTKTSRIEQARSACRLIARALQFPFVKTTIWGYAGGHGQVDIAQFDTRSEIFELPSRMAASTRGTPTHIAVKLATSHLRMGSEVKHLFVLTDGRPTFSQRNGVNLNWKRLVEKTGDEVKAARCAGVDVTGIMIGDEKDITDEHMARMFGPSRYWKRVSGARFTGDLVSLVSGSFVSYLNRK